MLDTAPELEIYRTAFHKHAEGNRVARVTRRCWPGKVDIYVVCMVDGDWKSLDEGGVRRPHSVEISGFVAGPSV